MTYGDYKIHPLADVFPLLEGKPFDDFASSIAKNGLLEPIVMLDGAVLDGRNRLRACLGTKTPPRFVDYDKPMAAEEYVWAVNVERRHLTDDQKAAVVMAWEAFETVQAKARGLAQLKTGAESPSGSNDPDGGQHAPSHAKHGTRGALANRAKVSYRKINDARLVKRHDEKEGTELLKRVEAGDMKLSEAKVIAGIAPKPKVTQKPRAERADEIREFASQGYSPHQIAKRTGMTSQYVGLLAGEEGIKFTTAGVRAIKVDRVIEQTVIGAEALVFGLDGMLGGAAVEDINGKNTEAWIESLSASIGALVKLLKQLKAWRAI